MPCVGAYPGQRGQASPCQPSRKRGWPFGGGAIREAWGAAPALPSLPLVHARPHTREHACRWAPEGNGETEWPSRGQRPWFRLWLPPFTGQVTLAKRLTLLDPTFLVCATRAVNLFLPGVVVNVQGAGGDAHWAAFPSPHGRTAGTAGPPLLGVGVGLDLEKPRTKGRVHLEQPGLGSHLGLPGCCPALSWDTESQ